MKIQYDKIADALYIYFTKQPIKKTSKINERVLVDTDKNGNIVGVEVLDVSSQISKSWGSRKLREQARNGVPLEIIAGTPVAA